MKVFALKATIVLICFCNFFQHTSSINATEKARALSLFSVITFNNDPCSGNGRNGTCYTSEECTSKGGTNSGTCAEGYGVCCTFVIGCGTRSAENCTYFESAGSESGGCTATICKCNNNVCQLRLDFTTFMIEGPTSSTVTTLKILNGLPNAAGGLASNRRTQCETDRFSVSSNGFMPPVICGTNSGEHMYVDADDACNDLNFVLGNNAMAMARSWSIKVTQIGCNDPNRAPDGCTQYFFETKGSVQTYNFQGGLHLASQNQNICFRRDINQCRVCFSNVDTDFSISGDAAAMAMLKRDCCNYGANGKGKSYDCLIVPSQSKSVDGVVDKSSVFCGDKKVLKVAGVAGSVCTRKAPLMIRFLSDAWDLGTNSDKGFKLSYEQKACV